MRGQATVAGLLPRPARCSRAHLVPNDPPAVPEAVDAVLDADWVVPAPPLASSVIPHLLVPDLAGRAQFETKARRVLSLEPRSATRRTEASHQRHLEVLGRHAPKLALDVVLADEAAVPDRDSLTDAAKRFGAAVELAPVARTDGPRGTTRAAGRRVRPYFFGCMEGSARGR